MHVFLSQPALWGQGHFDIVKFLVDCGANIHANYNYALQWKWSTYNDHPYGINFLISKGATLKI